MFRRWTALAAAASLLHASAAPALAAGVRNLPGRAPVSAPAPAVPALPAVSAGLDALPSLSALGQIPMAQQPRLPAPSAAAPAAAEAASAAAAVQAAASPAEAAAPTASPTDNGGSHSYQSGARIEREPGVAREEGTREDEARPARAALQALGALAPDEAARAFDVALTGRHGARIMERRKAEAVGALQELERRRAEEADGQVGAAPEPITPERVYDWILGQEALIQTKAMNWLIAGFRGPAAARYDFESFRLTLTRLNEALAGLSLRAVDPEIIDVLEEGEPFFGLDAEGTSLRELGAFHELGRIKVYAVLGEALTARQLAAVALHERLAMLGYEHDRVVELMQRATRAAFGEPVLDADLQGLVRRALAGPKEGSPRWRAEAPRSAPPAPAEASRQEEPWPIWPAALLSGWLMVLLVEMFDYKLFGKVSWDWIVYMGMISAVTVLWKLLSALLGRGAARSALPTMGGVPYSFDRASLGFMGTLEGVDPDMNLPYWGLRFRDHAGWEVALLLHHDEPEVPGGRVLEVQWARGGLQQDRTHGRFFVFSRYEANHLANLARESVPAAAFRDELLPDFERALERYASSPGVLPSGAWKARDILDRFRRTLQAKDDDSPPVEGRWGA